MKFNPVISAVAMAALAQALLIPQNVDALEAFNNLLTNDVEANSPNHHKAAKFEKVVIANDDESEIAPLVMNDKEQVPDSYIVVFKEDVDASTAASHELWVEQVHTEQVASLAKRDLQHPFLAKAQSGLKQAFAIGSNFKGYSGTFHADTIELLRRHKDVAYVEKDSIVNANEFATELDAPWGLARVSHRKTLNLGSFNKYLYDDVGGEGVTSYVIDTGVNVGHDDFGGRAKWGKTVPTGDADEDGNGHGTHCAGTIGGTKYGVAKKANIVAVKVLRSNGSGTMSDVVAGVEFAAKSHAEQAKKNPKGFKGSTANMSLGGGKSPSLDLAVNAAVKAGIHFAVAAGNDNADACNYSPAAAENAVTVGASTLSDARAYFSNYGKCVDIFGPGLNILSTYIGSKQAVATLSGTSMASPHIAGLLSYYLSLQPESDSAFATSSITPAQLKKNLISFASVGVLSDIDADTPNVLAYNGGGEDLKDFWAASKSAEQIELEENIHEAVDHAGNLITSIRKIFFGF